MAFSASAFHRIAHGNGQNAFLYTTADAIAAVAGSGYFNAVHDQLGKGDIILASTSTGGAIAVDVLVVSSATGATTVTTTNGT